ncbi:MAG: right-handed parallel beta-helix repeat-containing protein [Bacteroidota bacterium]
MQHKNDKEYVYSCNVEDIDTRENKFKETSEQGILFGNIDIQSDDYAFSGTFSGKLFPGSPYGLTTSIKNVKPDDYIKVTAWRKSGDEMGVIALDGGPGFYHAGNSVIETAGEWQKIIVEYFVPPNFYKGKVKIYVWNNGQDTVYFDDLEIIHRNRKQYPEFENLPALQIHADKMDLNKLNKKRLQAFNTTVLVNSDEDYSNVVIYDGSDFLNGSFRLKGDLVDHIQGTKWSFRIKLKRGFVWNNLRTFSIQNPSTRNFLHEWIAHQVFKQEDVLSTRYGFVPVKLNNESLGIYAWEEHFEKQLIESQNRREGPIVRFDESLFWQRVIETIQSNREWDIDYFNAARITPFKAGRTTADSMLNMQLGEAHKLMLQYKKRLINTSQIFDIDKLAKYYALIDITQAYHGFAWHNQRFYYNPVTCLLEPIAFDGYIEGGIYKRIDEQVTGLLHPDKIMSFREEELVLYQPFTDEDFREKYVGFLQKYSQPEFINELILVYSPQTDSLSELINKEFPYYHFSFDDIKNQAMFIQENIKSIGENVERLGIGIEAINSDKFKKVFTSDINKNLLPYLVQAYYNKKEKQINILNFHNSKVEVLGVFIEGALPENFEDKPELEPYNGKDVSMISLPVDGIPLLVLFEVDGELLETEVSPWSYSNQLTERQATELSPLPAKIKIDNNVIIFDGHYTFQNDIVIPDSFIVLAKPGTKINLVNGAAFISFSPVKFTGTEDNPIEVVSGDNSANGFNILQPEGKSVLEHVQFSGLSNLRKAGWQTPSAITFYEADVKLVNCIFVNNSNCDDALNIVRSEFVVQNCEFKNTFADAFDSDFCRGVVQNCTFENIGNDAIDFSGSRVEIADCKMTGIGDKAISGGEKSTLTVSSCEIDGANIGVAAKDLSNLKLDKITMNKTVYGLVAFVKKPEYGPANISIDNLKMKKNMVFHQIELGSNLVLNGKLIEGREKNLAVKLYQ